MSIDFQRTEIVGCTRYHEAKELLLSFGQFLKFSRPLPGQQVPDFSRTFMKSLKLHNEHRQSLLFTLDGIRPFMTSRDYLACTAFANLDYARYAGRAARGGEAQGTMHILNPHDIEGMLHSDLESRDVLY